MSGLRSAKCRALDVAMEALRRYARDQEDAAFRQGAEDILEDLTIHHLILSSQSEIPDPAPYAGLRSGIESAGLAP